MRTNFLLPAGAVNSFSFNGIYQPSTRSNGSESTLLECMVTNTTTSTNYTIVGYTTAVTVYINCTTGVLHPRPALLVPIPSQNFSSHTETSNISSETSKPSSPMPKPSQSSSSTTKISPETDSKCSYMYL